MKRERDLSSDTKIKAARLFYFSDAWISDDLDDHDDWERCTMGILKILCGNDHVDDSYGVCVYCREPL